MKGLSKLWWFCLIFAVVVFAIGRIFSFNVELYSTWYEMGLFPWIRKIYDYSLGALLPFPMVYLVLSIIVLLFIIYPTKHPGWKGLLMKLSGWIFVLYALFNISWGWHYNQAPLHNRLGLNVAPLTAPVVQQEAEIVINRINYLRKLIQNDSLAIRYEIRDELVFEDKIRTILKKEFQQLNLPTPGKPRIRILRPAGFLMRFKTAGIYFPYAVEGHIDKALLKIEWPFTMAHEMAHGYGITDEGACNFLALLACVHSKDPYLEYSALLDYSLYLWRDLRQSLDSASYDGLIKNLHPGYLADLKAIRDNGDLYPDILPQVRDFIYDQFLKGQGMSAGIKSYSQMLSWSVAYQNKYGKFWE